MHHAAAGDRILEIRIPLATKADVNEGTLRGYTVLVCLAKIRRTFRINSKPRVRVTSYRDDAEASPEFFGKDRSAVQ
jgi:hypothetical protein